MSELAAQFRFMHTSDWHLGACRNVTPNSEEHLARQAAVLENILELASHANIDFALIAGDLFENKGTTIPEFLLARRIIKELSQICTVISTDGNHDELQNEKFQSMWMEMLEIPNVHFVSKPRVIRIPTRLGGHEVKILAVPWTGIKIQDDFDRLVMSHLEPGVEIVMLHECFKNSVGNNGKRWPGGIEVPDIPDIKYFACGDIHIRQQLNLKHAWFSGAPMQYRFDDDPDKGVLIVDKPSGKPDYKVKYERIECPIHMQIVRDPKLVDPTAPVWYSLCCQADQIPLTRPPNLKKINPQPVAVEMPEAVAGDAAQPNQVRVDYAEGIDTIMGELGYDPSQIAAEQEAIRQLVR